MFTSAFYWALVATVVAGICRGMLGFGAMLIIVPCLVILYGPIEAVVVASIIEIPAILYLLPTVIRGADWRLVAPAGIASLTTIPLGAWALVTMDPNVAHHIIAVAVIVFALALASGWRYHNKPGIGLSISVGAASGIISGIANIGGPVVVMFLVASDAAAASVRAGIMAFFSISGLYRVLIYALLGIYAAPAVTLAMVLVLPYLGGIWVGARMFKHLPEKLFLRLAVGLVFTTGVVALLQ